MPVMGSLALAAGDCIAELVELLYLLLMVVINHGVAGVGAHQ